MRDENENAVQRICDLLGEAVLIPIAPLSKRPAIKEWEKKTLADMGDRAYLKYLAVKNRNIGVSLGRASNGLCTIDFDDDAAVEPFLADNPLFRNTTTTKRVRGCNFWIRIDGEYQPNKKLPFGEWRADGMQTVIWGQAIGKGETEPTPYRFINEVQPIKIRFADIKFPAGCFDEPPTTPTPIRLDTESCIAKSLHDCISASCVPASLHNKDKSDSVLANIKAKKVALDALAALHPHLVRLYNEFIEPRFQAKAQARNNFIVEAVPFLYRAVAPQHVMELVGCFYDCNRALFHDPREQHMKESKAMLESVSQTYAESLNAAERAIYDALPGHEQDTFRICRDLAMLPEPERPALTFFLSFNHLADRLGVYPMQAQRIMRQLESYGLIKTLKKGTKRALGIRAEAGIYHWEI